MIEATEYFQQLIKQKQFNSSIQIFSSIVEGYNAIQGHIDQSLDNETINSINNKLLKMIKEITAHLEAQNFIKIDEIIQFSFLPTLKRFNAEVNKLYEGRSINNITNIGLYYGKKDPTMVYPKERVEAFLKASDETNTNLFFFSDEDVDLNDKKILGKFHRQGVWVKETVDFPEVIYNIFPNTVARQSRIERKLRREIPFTSFVIGDKLTLPFKIVKQREFAHLLVPFRVITDKKILIDSLKEYGKAVIKPVRGARGENIYFVEEKGDKIKLSERENHVILSYSKFYDWLDEVIFSRNKKHLIQKYIHTRTKTGQPFDFRAHMQKNGEGRWQITKLYPRTGNKKSNQISINRGQPLKDIEDFLKKEFDAEWEEIFHKLQDTALNLSFHIDKLYGLAIDELGIDIAIDKNRRFWIHEANLGPQTKAHEVERAINTLKYCEYLAKHQIFYTNEFNERDSYNFMFSSKSSRLPYKEINQNLIGLIENDNQSDRDKLAYGYVSSFNDCTFVYFNPKDVDIDEMLIKGKVFEESEWREYVVRYPDVLINNINHTPPMVKHILDDFEGIPMIENKELNNLEVLKVLRKEGLEELLIESDQLISTKDTLSKLKNHKQLILRDCDSNSFNSSKVIKRESHDYCFVSENKQEMMNQLKLSHQISDLIKNKSYYIQYLDEMHHFQDNLFVASIQLQKNLNGEWELIAKHPKLFSSINEFLMNHYLHHQFSLIDVLNETFYNSKSQISKLEKSSKGIGEVINQELDKNISFLSVEFVLQSSEFKVFNIKTTPEYGLINELGFVENQVKNAVNLMQI
ncbi:YheC/YheD family protein [Halalkalibacillus sediminis]|nr:YheC/YheD family protein [Halalkalibacillus sediminis]